MKEIKETCYKGTRILLGNEKRRILNNMINVLIQEGFEEISIPVIQYTNQFSSKVGDEKLHQMFKVTDGADRQLTLAPEYTSIIMELSKTTFKQQKDVKLFYIQECFRGEKPQAGRYRQFTQLGVEILNPIKDYNGYLQEIAFDLINIYSSINTEDIVLNTEVKRGLDYYKEGKGFEISCDFLGSSKQICGGGEYEGGVGFAIGIDRLLLIHGRNNPKNK